MILLYNAIDCTLDHEEQESWSQSFWPRNKVDHSRQRWSLVGEVVAGWLVIHWQVVISSLALFTLGSPSHLAHPTYITYTYIKYKGNEHLACSPLWVIPFLDKPARLIIRFVFVFCIWLWDECGDPLRADAKKVMASKMIFWVTWCSENDCQPSCTLQLHTDVLLFTSSSLKPLQNCHLDQSVPSAYRFWSSICLSFREQYLSQLKFHISFSMEFQLCRELIVSVAVFHCFSSYLLPQRAKYHL